MTCILKVSEQALSDALGLGLKPFDLEHGLSFMARNGVKSDHPEADIRFGDFGLTLDNGVITRVIRIFEPEPQGFRQYKISENAIVAAAKLGYKGSDVAPALRFMAQYAARYSGQKGINYRFYGIGFLIQDEVVLDVQNLVTVPPKP